MALKKSLSVGENQVHHLVSVWNPAYGTDVMETHIALLRERAQHYRGRADDEDDVYVW